MKINMQLLHRAKGNPYNSLITQGFESWQRAMKETQGYMTQIQASGGSIVSVTFVDRDFEEKEKQP